MSEPRKQESDVSALERSATTRTVSVEGLDAWLAAAAVSSPHSVTSQALEALNDWYRVPESGDIAHKSGRFFRITGVRTTGHHSYDQPIILQPDIGILGLIGKIEDGAALFLVQAKVEPGNRRLAQLSPTVQATSSNFERIHGGRETPYLSIFHSGRKPPGNPLPAGHSPRTLIDIEQSEQSTRFLGKRNRNMIVFADDLVQDLDPTRFRWVTAADLFACVFGDDLLHMDTRSVLGSLGAFFTPKWTAPDAAKPGDGSSDSHRATKGRPEGRTADVERWLSAVRDDSAFGIIRVPLVDVAGWDSFAGELRARTQESGAPRFDVVGVRTEAGSREVSSWDQPLLRNHPGRESALVAQFQSGVLHVLLSATRVARPSPGIEIGPTLLREPVSRPVDGASSSSVRAIESMLEMGRTLLDVELPEEGGRFLHSNTRHRIIVLAEDAIVNPGHPFCWVDFKQLGELLNTPLLCSIELRSLLSCCSPALDWRG